MKSNASLKEIGEILKQANRILVFPHINPDGDALGSAIALCQAMRKEGKTAWVLLEEEIPEYIGFLEHRCCTKDANCIAEPDVCICVDCSEEKRFPGRVDAFRRGKLKLTLDHHLSESGFGDYYYIDETAGAAAQIVFQLMDLMNWEIDRTIAESLYVGLVTDTGCFQYSNTTAETHRIAGILFQAGIRHNDIMVKLYQNVSRKKIQLQSRILENMDIFGDGTCAMACVTEAMLKETGAVLEDAEGTVDILRNIEGVELAAFLKEKPEEVKVSLRAKSYGNVDKIARRFAGGGHVKAAGCGIKAPIQQAAAQLKKEMIASLQEDMASLRKESMVISPEEGKKTQ